MAASVPFHYIRSLASNQVLDIYNGEVETGTAIILWDKNYPTSLNQLWKFENIGDGRCNIVSAANPNMCLDVEYSEGKNGVCLLLYDKYSPAPDHQLWTWNDGVIRSCLAPGTFVIDAKQANNGEADTAILWEGHGGENQRWVIDYQ